MYKIFTLAVAVSVLPVSKQFYSHGFITDNAIQRPANIFPYKNTFTSNPFEAKETTTEVWSQNWMATAQENIRKSEYHFKWEEKLKAYCTPNRKNNLRFFYNDEGFAVEPRTTQMPVGEFDPLKMPDDIKYRYIPNWKIKFDLDKKQVGKGLWKVTENKAEYIADKITVQYINNDEGMRQNFIVHEPLSKSNELKINLNIKTKLKNKLTGNQLQFFHKKMKVLNYEDLKVWDADNRPLTASFQKRKEGNYYIQVDTKNATFPITIDPISTIPSAILESNQASANLGFSVSSAGDVNGDGYSDVIAGATGYDAGSTDEGAAFIYHGSATGINNIAAATVESNQANARMGISVSTAGDVNADGFSDIIVGAMLFDNSEPDEGRAFIYHGSASGINNVAVTTVESNQALSQLGFSVACAGDVNNDGFSDVVVGAWLYSNGEGAEGRAFIYHGSASGINSTAVTTVESNQVNANLGISVAGAGDVNGDGYSDIIAGAQLYDDGHTDEGAVFVYNGSSGGINPVAAGSAQGQQDLCQFGFSVSGAGDVNGDGYSDVIVGAYLYDNGSTNEGVAFIYHGSPTSISNVPAAFVENNQPGSNLGTSVACAGDINGDGFSDVITGAIMYDNVESNEGAAYVYFGSVAGLNVIPAAILESNQANAQMGRGVASAGDVNGDGYSDVIAGAQLYGNGQGGEGGAFVFHGSAAGISTIAAIVESNLPGFNMGNSVASTGDVNGDGYSDVIVGNNAYFNGEIGEGAFYVYHGSATGINTTAAVMVESNMANASMGYSVAGAGDVNGDGYSDVIVGVRSYTGGQSFEGAAYIYHGSASGISTTAAAILEGNQASAVMGCAVAGAGDVNGDGYSDVIVGANLYDNGQADEGVAFIYYGSVTGINTATASMIESNQASAFFGVRVAGAGDVNGDGFSDVIVGANGYDNGQTIEGAAFVFHGSATGVNTAVAIIVECNQAGAQMGLGVAGAGDVNGDGYSDVIAAAPFYDNGQTDEGTAFVYHGSVTGINTAAVMIESDQVNAQMGWVAGAGDVNGDGYSDVIVGVYQYDSGQTDEGVAFIYHGSITGISSTTAAFVESNQVMGWMGFAVASAGDVNGDGYSDIIAGVFSYDNGEVNEGGAFIYHGNSPGNNKRNNLRLYNADLATPVNSPNFILSNFGTGLYAKSFLGRDKGKLVWETRLNYNAYSGTPITNSTFFTAQQAAYTDMGLTGIEIKNIIDKIAGGSRFTKLRARIKYDPVTAITGQVYSPWRNVSSVIDANHLGVLPIELISFNAAWLQKGKTARLDFKTDKESGICCFDIEKSADGFNFYSIGTLPAKNTSGIQSYSFIDGNATGKKQFYRLKIKGIAGQIDYSNIQQLQNNGSTEILVFPNPTTSVLQVRFNKWYDKMNVQIINGQGQTLKKISGLTSVGQVLSLPVHDLPAGRYWLKLQSNDEKQLLQFVKQ